jgi:hypothetical protein
MRLLPFPGLSVQDGLAGLELPRSTWYYHQRQRVNYGQKYRHLRPLLEAIARRSAEYGYRRTTVELREVNRQLVNHKVVQRLHRIRKSLDAFADFDNPLIDRSLDATERGCAKAYGAAC